MNNVILYEIDQTRILLFNVVIYSYGLLVVPFMVQANGQIKKCIIL